MPPDPSVSDCRESRPKGVRGTGRATNQNLASLPSTGSGGATKRLEIIQVCDSLKLCALARPDVAYMPATWQRPGGRSTLPGRYNRIIIWIIRPCPSSLCISCVYAGIAPAEFGRDRVRDGLFLQPRIVWCTPLESERAGRMPPQTQFLFQAHPAAPPVDRPADSFRLHPLRPHRKAAVSGRHHRARSRRF